MSKRTAFLDSAYHMISFAKIEFGESSGLLEGGPFVTVAGGKDTIAREPRVRTPEA